MMFWIGLGCGIAYLVLQSTKLLLAMLVVRSMEIEFPTQDDAFPIEELHLRNDAWFASVTLAQPILSGDPLLKSALQDVLHSLPEPVRILWLIDQSDTVAISIAREIAPDASWQSVAESETHPSLQSSRVQILVCPDPPPGTNPKSFKLEFALRSVNSTHFVVLDDDTFIDPKSLATAIQRLEQFDLSSGLPCYQRGHGIWSDCVAHWVNNNAVLTYLPPLFLFKTISLNGMFYAAKAETLRSIGGYEAIQHSLCDDYALHRLLVSKGLRVYQDKTGPRIGTTVSSFRHYIRLMHRWNLFAWLLTRDQSWQIRFYLTLFLGAPPWLLLTQIVFATIELCRGGFIESLFCLVVLIARQGIIHSAHRIAFDRRLSMNFFLSLFVELLQPIHLVTALCYPYITWRGRRIQVRSGQQFETVKST